MNTSKKMNIARTAIAFRGGSSGVISSSGSAYTRPKKKSTTAHSHQPFHKT
jgi:hypothetical protein